MRKKKRRGGLIAILLCLAVGMAAIPVSAATGEEPSVYLTVRQDEGEVVALIGLTAAEPVASVQLTLEYDDNLLEVKSAVFQKDYSGMLNAINTQQAGEVIFAAASASGVEADGAVMEVTFSPKADAAGQSAAFSIKDAIVGDEEGNVLLEEGSASAQFIVSSSSDSGIQGGNDDQNTDIPGDSEENGDAESGDGDNDISDVTNPQTEPFSDIEGHWAYDFIIDAYNRNLMEGYGNGIFGPDDSITRGQMAVALWNSAGNPEPEGSSPFTDLEKDWYRDAVIWAAEQGLVKGIGNGLYNPDGTLTREHLAQILFNQAGGVQGMESMLTAIYDGQYRDSNQISAWAKPALYWSIYQGILCGTDSLTLNDTLSPKSPASRAQIAVMLVRSDSE